MKEYKVVIPGEMPGMNKIINASKSHYQVYRRLKKENTELIIWNCKKLPNMKSVYLDITWYCKNKRRDPDNIAAAVKFIFDGLVEGGVLENDGWQQNMGWSNTFKVDKDKPRTEIIIKEVK